jgi:hypothetical protein
LLEPGIELSKKNRAKTRTDSSHEQQVVAPPRAFRFSISTDHKLLFMEQLDLDPGAATRSDLVNGFRLLTDQFLKTECELL